jgi:putative Mn2+ efflux pump MntP
MIAAAMLFISLGFDTLAVAVGLGLSGLPRQRWLRVGLTFALFEGLMPIIGLFCGERLSHALGNVAEIAAALLLLILGIREIKEALDDDDDDDDSPLQEGKSLLMSGLSVSLDELAVGFSLGVVHVAVGMALAYIAAQAFALTFLGLSLGQRLGRRFGERAELVAGIVLTLLGLALLVNHFTGSHFL